MNTNLLLEEATRLISELQFHIKSTIALFLGEHLAPVYIQNLMSHPLVLAPDQHPLLSLVVRIDHCRIVVCLRICQELLGPPGTFGNLYRCSVVLADAACGTCDTICIVLPKMRTKLDRKCQKQRLGRFCSALKEPLQKYWKGIKSKLTVFTYNWHLKLTRCSISFTLFSLKVQ